MSNIDLALKIAIEAHAGQTDRDGEAYILHPLTVGLMGKTDEERMTGFLHDVIEDTPCTAEELLERGIPEGVVGALRLLTHNKSLSYDDYVQRIIDSHNPIALKVKYYDLQHRSATLGDACLSKNFARGKAYQDLQKKHGAALEKVKKAVEEMERVTRYEQSHAIDAAHPISIAVFAAGCFWGVQHYMNRQKGVIRSLVGYTGGKEEFPTYEQVRIHHTGHVEAVLVEYDASVVSYETLCKLFFEIHDPAQTDGQGSDKGAQYRSALFYNDQTQLDIANNLIAQLRNKGYEVNTLLQPLTDFWVAEGYHQNYYEQTGGSPYCHIRTKKF